MTNKFTYALGFTASGTKILYTILRLIYENKGYKVSSDNCYFFNIDDENFFYLSSDYRVTKIEQNKIIDKITVGWNHTPIGNFKNSIFFKDENAKHIFIHRDVRDVLTSVLNSYATIKINSKYTPSFFNLDIKDVKNTWFYLDNYASTWLKHCYGYLSLKESILSICFNDVTADNVGDEYLYNVINKIKKYLNFNDLFVSDIVQQIKMLNKNSPQSTELTSVPKKIGRYKEFFNKNMIERINSHFGIGLVLLDYMSLEEFSTFIYKYDNFTCIIDGNDEDYILQYSILCFKKHHKNYKIVNWSDNFKYEASQKYILYSQRNIQLSQYNNSIYFPYYEIYFDTTIEFYIPYNKSIVTISQLKNSKIILLYQTSEPKVMSHIFHDNTQKIKQMLLNNDITVETLQLAPDYQNIEFDEFDYYLLTHPFMEENNNLVKRLSFLKNKVLTIYPFDI